MRITEITQSSALEYFVWVCRQILYIYFNVSWGMSLICSATVLVTQSTGISNHLYPMKWMEMPLIRSKFPHISARKTGKKNGPNNWSDLENVVSQVNPIWKHHGTRWRFYEQIRRAIAIIMKYTLWGFCFFESTDNFLSVYEQKCFEYELFLSVLIFFFFAHCWLLWVSVYDPQTCQGKCTEFEYASERSHKPHVANFRCQRG